MSYNTVSIGTSATLLVPANHQRIGLIITNTSSSLSLYIGPDNSITTSNAIQIPSSSSFTEDSSGTSMYKGAIWGISTNTLDCRFWERTDTR